MGRRERIPFKNYTDKKELESLCETHDKKGKIYPFTELKPIPEYNGYYINMMGQVFQNIGGPGEFILKEVQNTYIGDFNDKRIIFTIKNQYDQDITRTETVKKLMIKTFEPEIDKMYDGDYYISRKDNNKKNGYNKYDNDCLNNLVPTSYHSKSSNNIQYKASVRIKNSKILGNNSIVLNSLKEISNYTGYSEERIKKLYNNFINLKERCNIREIHDNNYIFIFLM